MKALTAGQVKRETRKGMHRVDESLYINVQKTGRKNWIQRIVINGRRMDLGLGPYPLIDTDTAKETALANRRKIREGNPPTVDVKRKKRVLFEQAAAETLEIKRGGWKNERHAKAWLSRLAKYVMPNLANCLWLPSPRPIWKNCCCRYGKLKTPLHAKLYTGFLTCSNTVRIRGTHLKT